MTTNTPEQNIINTIEDVLEPINWRVSSDVKKILSSVSEQEARFLVDYYYARQDARIRESGQIRALDTASTSHQVLDYLLEQSEKTEASIKKALDIYTSNHDVGRWIRKQYGFGPVLSAAFIAHIDISKSPTAGHLWSYAGINPNLVWNTGQIRPWNAELKRLCWIAGECIIKTSNNPHSYYGCFYKQVKADLMQKNENGHFRNQAQTFLNDPKFAKMRATLERNKLKREKAHAEKAEAFSNGEQTFQEQRTEDLFKGSVSYWMDGKLAPVHIHARARRVTVKLFLAHLHHVMWHKRFGSNPPVPYPIAHMGHVHFYAPPDYEYGYDELKNQLCTPRGYIPQGK